MYQSDEKEDQRRKDRDHEEAGFCIYEAERIRRNKEEREYDHKDGENIESDLVDERRFFHAMCVRFLATYY